MFAVAILLESAGCNCASKTTFSDPAVQRLASAAENGDVESIDQVIQNGADPNARGLENVTPLHVALAARNKAGFDALLRHGADPNLFDDRGQSVILKAAAEEESHWLEQCLKHGGKPNLLSPGTRRSSKGITPIFYAVDHRRGKNLKILIDAGADMNHVDGGGDTPWRSAVVTPAYDMLYIMVEAGVDFRKKDAIGQDLLELISSRKEHDMFDDDQKMWFRKTVELLKSKGAKVTLSGD